LGFRFPWRRQGRSALALGVGVLLFVATLSAAARAQQYFNGATTVHDGAINGGSGVWDTGTTNWTNATGTTSATYDPTASTVTVFGASGSSTPATGGTVTVTAGGIQLTGTVQFTGTGDNSPYTIVGGPLTLAAGGTTFNVTTNLFTPFFQPSGIISSNITGSGGVAVTGEGTISFRGTNTYTGGTLVSGDPLNGVVLQVTNGNALSTGLVTLQNGILQAANSNLTFSNNFQINSSALGGGLDANGKTLTIAGTIGGNGLLTIFNSGASGSVVLTAANTYSGGTFICSCATLQLGDLTHTASIIGSVDNEGRFRVSNADTSGITSILNNGLVQFLNQTNAGTATITNFEEVDFNNSSSAGNATITNGGFGIVAFSNNSTAGSATIIGTGNSTIGFQNQATAGNATIIVQDNAQVIFLDNANGGNAQFIANGNGVVDFSGSSGPTGNGVITAGSIAGAGTFIIGANNTLVVGNNNLSTVVSGTIEDFACGCGPGSGNLVKVGSGTLTLSGPNTYTGTPTVNGGFLDVEGSIASSSLTTVNAGGALTGAGVVGGTSIAPGGIFLPGNGFGTFMTVQGNLAFQSGALYLVQINSTTSTYANVTGAATLGGGTVGVAVAPGSFVMKQYMILQGAVGVSGAFDGVSAPGGLVGTITYDLNHAFLNLGLNFGAKNALNVNQQNVANTLSNFFNANGGISSLFALLSPAGLTQASGELATGAQQATFNAMNIFLNLLTDPFIGGRSGGATTGGATGYAEDDSASAYAAKHSGVARDAFAKIPTKAEVARNDLFDNRWSVWGTAFGGGANISGNAAIGSNPADVRAFGFAAGADYRISPTTIAGFALGGGGTNFSVAGSGTGRSDLFQAGAFVRHSIGNAYVTAAAAYGGQQFTTDRTVTAGDFEQLHAQFNANAWSGRIEGGYRYVTPWMGITPYAAAQFTTFNLPAYSERDLVGTGAFALNYAAKNVTDSRTELGFRTDRSFALQTGILTLRGRFAWAHDFDTDRNVTALFQTLPGAFFVVNGGAVAHDSALTTASAEMKWMNGWSAAATFEGEFSSVLNSYAGKGVVRYAW
jgi:autotransporter-associated beta strand protein